MEETRMEFLVKAALSDTLCSSLQRANVYVQGVTDARKRQFKGAFKRKLCEIEPMYRIRVDNDSQHIETIRAFAESLSQDFRDILQGEGIRIGVAQKGVNLFLKYMWSLGRIPEPPHCPIDAIVLREIGDDAKWTRLRRVGEYERIIELCRQADPGQSLARWELDLYNRRAS
jgi:hypothetical protein